MTSIAVSQASATQLAEFAQNTLGLDVQFRMGRDKILAAIRSTGYDKDAIEVSGEAGPAMVHPGSNVATEFVRKPPETDDAKKHHDYFEEYVEIMIPSNEGPGGNEAVPVAVNGRTVYIPRDQEVAVRRKYIEALKNARKRTPLKDGNNEIINWREALMYPYSIIADPASPAAIDRTRQAVALSKAG